MEDFSALAATLAASVGDVRGCLVLSRDGLVLGAYPEGDDSSVKPAWLRFASLGEPERGFLQFGVEVWCYVRRGPYAAFATTGISVRPGLVIDQMEMVLLAAEETRSKREGLRGPEPATTVSPAAAPSGKPRTPLHPETRPVDEPVVIHAEAAAASVPPESAVPQGVIEAPATPTRAPGPAIPGRGGAFGEASDEGEGNEDEVDRVMLAREFSQLLQEDSDGADG
jgi:hypothetical protein